MIGSPGFPIVGGMDIPFAIPECRVARFAERDEDHLVIPMRLDADSSRCPDCQHASGPSIAATSAIPPTCRCRHRRPVSASRCGGSTAATRPADAALRRDAYGPPRARAPVVRGGSARRRPGSASPAAVRAAPVSSRTSICRPAARPCCGSSPACRCPTRRLPSGSASTTGRSGRAAVTARSSSTSTVTASSISSRIARHPRWPAGSNGTPASNSSPGSLDRVRARHKPRRSPGATGRRSLAPAHQYTSGRRTLAPRRPCPVAQPAAPPWLDRSSRPAQPRLCPFYDGVGSGGTEPDTMAGHLRRGPPSARRGEPLLAIARALGLARATVRKYASAEAFPARLPHGAGPSLLDPHVAYLAGRIDEGCENAMALWREIREQGYPGRAIQGRAGRCIASSPSEERGRSDQAANSAVPRPAPRSRLSRKPRCRQHGSWPGCSCSRPRCWMRATQLW